MHCLTWPAKRVHVASANVVGNKITINMLILIIGLPGVGKTTFAKLLQRNLNFEMLSTEEVRSLLFQEGNIEEDRDFTKKELKSIYNYIHQSAKDTLGRGRSIIVEGVYRSSEDRNKLIKLSQDNNLGFLGFYVYCSEATALKRIIKRKISGTKSPAGVLGYKKIKKEFEKADDFYIKINTD